MTWGSVAVQEQRIRFVVAASRKEKAFRHLCAEFDISAPTGNEWLRRYEAGGYQAVQEKSRRPHHSPEKTSAEKERRIVELRHQRPDWGARKLQHRLKDEGIVLPKITIHRVLLRHGLVRAEDRHRPAVKSFQRAEPNQLWQMDFKSPIGWDAPVGPLSVLDDNTRYAVKLHGTWT